MDKSQARIDKINSLEALALEQVDEKRDYLKAHGFNIRQLKTFIRKYYAMLRCSEGLDVLVFQHDTVISLATNPYGEGQDRYAEFNEAPHLAIYNPSGIGGGSSIDG